MKFALSLSAVFALLLLGAPARTAAQSIEQLREIYNKAATSIDDAHQQKLDQLGDEYGKHLDKLVEETKNKGDLNGYKKAQAEKDRFSKEKTIPSDSPFTQYVDAAERERMGEVVALSGKYLARLKKLKVELMRKDLIAEAETIDAEMRKIEFIVADLQGKVGSEPPRLAGTTGTEPSNALAKGLVLYYDFSTRSTAVKDLSGQGNDGKVNGAKWLANGRGLRNGTYEFDGKDDRLIVPHSAGLVFDKELTVAAWVRVNDDKRHQVFIAKYHVASGQRGFSLDYSDAREGPTASRALVATVSASGSRFNGGKAYTDAKLKTRAWHHVALRFTPSEMRLYVDGKDRTAGFAFGSRPGSIFPSNRPIIIGGSEEAVDQTLGGCIDDVMIWNRALTGEEILSVYKGTRP